MWKSKTALIFNLKFANINFPCVRKWSRMDKLDSFHEHKNHFSFTRRYFQDNSEAPKTEIIQKCGIALSG